MSGIEIVGLAASVLQLADAGFKLSVKLYTFTRKIKSADRDIDALSQEIATTGAVLQQLGGTLSARKLIEDCKLVFTRLEKKINTSDEVTSNDPSNSAGSQSKRGFVSFRRRLNFTFLESEISLLRANLERLKSSLLVILNVLVLAEQIRNREAHSILKDQKSLLETLVEEKSANEKRYNELRRLITDRDSNVSASARISRPEMTVQKSSLPLAMQHHHERIVDHGWLVTNILQEIDSPKYKIDLAHRLGLHNGILDLHWNAWNGLRQTYGHQVFTKLFSTFHDVSRHWNDRALLADQFMVDADVQAQHPSELQTAPQVQKSPHLTEQAQRGSRVEHELVSRLRSVLDATQGDEDEEEEEYVPKSLPASVETEFGIYDQRPWSPDWSPTNQALPSKKSKKKMKRKRTASTPSELATSASTTPSAFQPIRGDQQYDGEAPTNTLLEAERENHQWTAVVADELSGDIRQLLLRLSTLSDDEVNMLPSVTDP